MTRGEQETKREEEGRKGRGEMKEEKWGERRARGKKGN